MLVKTVTKPLLGRLSYLPQCANNRYIFSSTKTRLACSKSGPQASAVPGYLEATDEREYADSPADVIYTQSQPLVKPNEVSTSSPAGVPLSEPTVEDVKSRSRRAENGPAGKPSDKHATSMDFDMNSDAWKVDRDWVEYNYKARASVFGVGNAYTNSPLRGSLRIFGGHKPRWTNGSLYAGDTNKRLPKHWLRDNCHCNDCIHPVTKQRQSNVFALKDESSFTIVDCTVGETSVEIAWEDGHNSRLPMEIFEARGQQATEAYRRGLDNTPRLWDSSIRNQPPSVDYGHVQRHGVGELLRQIRVYGFCFVPDSPETPEATQSLLEMIGPIRNTHYGGFYDFTSDMASKDTAYTDLALEAHTDTTYFTEPAGLQAFHMLSHTGGEGGKSLLVDGFNAANDLFRLSPWSYRWLAGIGIHSHASGNEDVSIQPYQAFPVLEHDQTHKGHLFRVRWNNSDRAGLATDMNYTTLWYEAAAKFNEILSSEQNQYWFQLQPGTPLIFDNWRILHGRSAFTGKRRMCGAYINHDDYISKYRLTNYGREDVMMSTVTG